MNLVSSFQRAGIVVGVTGISGLIFVGHVAYLAILVYFVVGIVLAITLGLETYNEYSYGGLAPATRARIARIVRSYTLTMPAVYATITAIIEASHGHDLVALFMVVVAAFSIAVIRLTAPYVRRLSQQ